MSIQVFLNTYKLTKKKADMERLIATPLEFIKLVNFPGFQKVTVVFPDIQHSSIRKNQVLSLNAVQNS